MDTLLKNLDIVFRGIQPETLFRSISGRGHFSGRRPEVSASHIEPDMFQALAYPQYPQSSYEEIEGVRQLLESSMTPDSARIPSTPSVFFLLAEISRRVLRLDGSTPVCRFSQLLSWQTIYQKLGQDLFTTAFVAYHDLRCGWPSRSEFAWDPVLKTDNAQLNTLLQRGIAENHCHLGGTSQNFALSWACLMNYPHTIRLAVGQIRKNLQANQSRGFSDNVWSWDRRLCWAAFLRVKLFLRMAGGCPEEHPLNMDHTCFHALHSIKQELMYVRSGFAAKVPQRSGRDFILDYALRAADCRNGLLESHNRLLSGERSFLYRCFRACFDGTFSPSEQDWFYLYLLLKENFRAELVQVNRQPGFQNFKSYQDRKDGIYETIPGYRAEAVRLSVNGNQSSQNIVSFEARIAPKDSAAKMCRQVLDYEAQIKYAQTAEQSGKRHFFVYHFIKVPDPYGISHNRFLQKPRNCSLRAASRRSARALGYALQHYPRFSRLVRGIDAANIEIGCRPEVFAVEFRYLRNIRPLPEPSGFGAPSAQPHIQVTYHVGEDFLDIADGLRAIDEAVHFLHLDRGDRLGHALALGVDPSVHYKYKQHRSVLCKQDLLDNLVWLLYRTQELDVPISPKLHSMLKAQADRYLSEIYGESMGSMNLVPRLYEYYCSMQLRGDAPEMYSGTKLHPFLENISCNAYLKDDRGDLEGYRNSSTIQALCQCYHFDRKTREKGQQIQEFSITGEYVELIRHVQDKLAEELAEKGIMIECNPTSNYLIGTFRRYDVHPIFRFNNVGLIRTDGSYEPSAQLSVSINTDDSGIFDTSLENEYAVIAASLERAEKDGRKKYAGNSVYSYLENVRKMGLDQSFQGPTSCVRPPLIPSGTQRPDFFTRHKDDPLSVPIL